MNKVPFGNTGFQVSVLGFGSAPAAFLKTDVDAAVSTINALLDQGINLLDTATMYPGSQEFIGQHFAKRRKDYVLVSKCGTKVEGVDAPEWSEKLITISVDRALKQLQTEQIDVMLIHSCDLATLKKGEAIGALVKAREAGKIKFVGYSGDNEALAYAAALPDVRVVETSVSIADQRNIDLGLAVAKKNNLGVLAKRPIANAAWKDINHQPGLYKGYAATYTDRLAKLNVKPADLGFPGDPAAAWPEIALRFTLGQPGVSTAIVGTTKRENALKNIEIAKKGPLPAEAIKKLRDAFKAADPDGKWMGQS